MPRNQEIFGRCGPECDSGSGALPLKAGHHGRVNRSKSKERLFLALGMLVIGCDATVDAPRQTPRTPRTFIESHDFGVLIGDEQKRVEHVFSFKNIEKQAVHVLSVKALRPCCSSIGLLPRWIEPGETIFVKTAWKVGNEQAAKRAAFEIQTDSDIAPTWRLELGATVVPRNELRRLGEGVPRELSLGESCRWRWLMTTHRNVKELSPEPIKVRASEPLRILPLEPARRSLVSRDVVAVTQQIEIELANTDEIGHKSGEFVVTCRDGASINETIGWDVLKPIQISPSGTTLDSEEGAATRTIRVESRKFPFRILEISSPLRVKTDLKLPTNADLHHVVTLRLENSKDMTRVASVLLKTDHPSQSEVMLSVFILGQDLEGDK